MGQDALAKRMVLEDQMEQRWASSTDVLTSRQNALKQEAASKKGATVDMDFVRWSMTSQDLQSVQQSKQAWLRRALHESQRL